MLGAAKGLWHAHLGWLFTTVGQADRRQYGADLLKDRGIRLIDAMERPLIVASLAIPFLLGLVIKGSGESWHNNHHAFPTSAFQGLRWREFDPGGMFIRSLERLGLAWDVVRISPDRQREKVISLAACPEHQARVALPVGGGGDGRE